MYLDPKWNTFMFFTLIVNNDNKDPYKTASYCTKGQNLSKDL